jgi:hypothetical protein
LRQGNSAGERIAACAVAFIATAWAATALAQDGQLSLRAGIERVSGDYGSSEELSDLYMPLTVLYDGRRLGFRATLPYLEVEFTDAVTSLPYTESGLGDVILGLTVYDVLRSSDGSIVVDITNKLKLGTADELKGLGTGETDYSVQADIYKFFGRSTLVGSAGYKLRGEPAAVTIDDTWFMSAGSLYRFTDSVSGGLFLDYRQSSVPGNDSIRELTASISRRMAADWRIQAYLVRGLGDTSLDWGAGMSVRLDL